MFGAIIGSALAHNPGLHASKKFGLRLLFGGIIFGAAAALTVYIQAVIFGYKYFLTDNIFVILMRLSGLLLLSSAMSFWAISLKRIPDIVKLVGRYTLLIYVVHIIILYGSAWIPGFGMFWPKSLNLINSIFAALAMIVLMFLLVHTLDKYKSIWKRKFLTSKAITE